MRGAVFLGNRKIEIRNFPDPTPGPGEVVIQMKASGMCGSDLKFYRPPPGEAQQALGLGGNAEPFIAGHEPCGIIAARGPGVSEREAPIGQRVMDHHYAGCGVCGHCRLGWSQLCREGITVFGQGPVGISATLLGAKMGARVIAIETNDERLALAKRFGADAAVNSLKLDPEKTLKEMTRGVGVDLALDCTGAAAARLAAVRSAKTWGTVCFVGEGGEVTLDVSRDLLRRQITLIGSWTFSAMGMAECARFVADNDIKLERIFTHRWTLDQVDEAYKVFDTQSSGKGVIEF